AFMSAGDHLDNGTFAAATSIKTGNPRQTTVTIEHQAHLCRAEKQVIAAVIRHQKTKTITVAANATENQVKLVDRGIGAAPGIDQLTVALHGTQTATQRFQLLISDQPELCGQLLARGRRATLVQVL